MYSLLIADDEIISRLGISNLLDWEAEGFQLIDSVENGELALEILREQPVDLVLTDVKMPLMTGIELISKARSEGINSQFIVLSSYDDYSFVREALKMGALDYILKLDLNKEHMQSVLQKAREQIEQNSSGDRSQPLDRQTLNSARRDFLKQLFYGKVSFDEHLADRLNHLQLSLPHHNFVTLMFRIENLPSTAGEGGIRRVIEEVLEEYEYAYICGTGFNELCILYNLAGKEELDLFKCIERLAKRVIFLMKQYFNQSAVLYISDIKGSIEEIPESYQQVNQAYSYKNVFSSESILFYKEIMERRSDRAPVLLESFVGRFEKAIQKDQPEELNQIFKEILEYTDTTRYIELGQISSFVFSLTYVIRQYEEDAGIQIKLWENEEEQFNALQSIRGKEDFTTFLTGVRAGLEEALAGRNDNHIIRSVKKYLNDHYTEGVVLKDVADYFGLTHTYLSMLFRKETGVTLKDYLIGLKIEKTKELLRKTNLQIAEISKEIGYDNEHYFSRIFKQKTGMTPTAYRNSGSL
ncbi:MAG: response regulator [Spirochaetales bacterium]|nr:response regulator [Spirochaetales bacterium]